MSRILQCWRQLQSVLFPDLEDELGPQTPAHGRIMVVLDWLDIGRFLSSSPPPTGRPPACRQAMACAFVAKAVLNLPSTRALIDRLANDRVLWRLCGFPATRRLPCEATFSNAFAEFAASGLLGEIHAAVIKSAYRDQLGGKLVGHISRDSTDIAVRIKVRRKRKKGPRKKGPRGKHRRLHRQLSMSLPEMLGELPTAADAATKRGHSWKGFKLHLDVADNDIPISAVLTSASVHDSQVAIPLEKMTASRVVSLYSLMDAAYDADEVRQVVRALGKVPIIDRIKRDENTPGFTPAECVRYRERTAAERVMSRVKDGLGGRHVTVREAPKVMAHLMFGILALTAEQMVRHYGTF